MTIQKFIYNFSFSDIYAFTNIISTINLSSTNFVLKNSVLLTEPYNFLRKRRYFTADKSYRSAWRCYRVA